MGRGVVVMMGAVAGCNSNDTSPEQHVADGQALQEEGKLQEAIAEFDEAVRIDPQLASAYSFRGTAHGLLGEYERAMVDLNEAIRLDPQDAEYYINRGGIYYFWGRSQENQDESVEAGESFAKAEADFARAEELEGTETP